MQQFLFLTRRWQKVTDQAASFMWSHPVLKNVISENIDNTYKFFDNIAYLACLILRTQIDFVPNRSKLVMLRKFKLLRVNHQPCQSIILDEHRQNKQSGK